MVEIFGTLGPACAQVDMLKKMFQEGMTGMRLNLSHGGLKESRQSICNFWEAARLAGVKPQLLIDMQGPEVRIGDLLVPLQLMESQEIELACQPSCGPKIPVSAQILGALEIGDRILLDDGKMELEVMSISKGQGALARVLRGGVLQKRKSLKAVGKQIEGPVITNQDKENIRLAKEYGVTALMQPFVTKGEQLIQVRKELLKNQLGHIRIFAKIENREGMKNIRDILPGADMVVIARGDLGNDMPLWKLPAAQRSISQICRKEGKPFLVVTQLLASMVQKPYPTRAEVSDIFHAVLDGAAAVMATNETAVGGYPAEVIKYLKKTAQEAAAFRGKEAF